MMRIAIAKETFQLKVNLFTDSLNLELNMIYNSLTVQTSVQSFLSLYLNAIV